MSSGLIRPINSKKKVMKMTNIMKTKFKKVTKLKPRARSIS